ncbi:hypothetical protein WN944_002125 [Citrus x changshan-huyou]|uniref:Uncharacterized protein n=1 Tax=Citrus x changshan-huyou TaxID=2935761 RepID=A0AAP0QRH9_9ROSI
MSTIRTRPPNPRRPKMSTTTISNDERDFYSAAASADYVTKKLIYKHRKVAIFFAYCGVDYDGMQKYLGVKTIEAISKTQQSKSNQIIWYLSIV